MDRSCDSTAAAVTAVSAMAVAAAATGDAVEVWAASAAVALLAMAQNQGSTDHGLCRNGVAVQIKATAATDRMGCQKTLATADAALALSGAAAAHGSKGRPMFQASGPVRNSRAGIFPLCPSLKEGHVKQTRTFQVSWLQVAVSAPAACKQR